MFLEDVFHRLILVMLAIRRRDDHIGDNIGVCFDNRCLGTHYERSFFKTE